MISRSRLLTAAASVPVVLAGCRVRTINYFPPSTANVRFANVTLGSAGMDVQEGDTTVWSAIPFQQSTEFAGFENQQKTFSLYATGSPDLIASTTIVLAGEQSYTLLSYGSTEATYALLAPDASPNAGNNNFLIRIIHAAAGLPGFDVYFADPSIPVDSNLGANFANLQSGSSTVAISFGVGTYSLRITIASTKSVVYDSGPIDFGGNLSIDFVLYTLGSAVLPQTVRLDVNEGGTRAVVPNLISTARIVNGAPDAGTIDVTIAGTSVASALAYATSSFYNYTSAGTSAVSAQATAAPGTPIATLEANFGSATDSTIMALGLPGAVRMVALTDDNRAPLSGQTRVRFVNGSSDTAAYDVYFGEGKVVTALAAGTAAAYVAVPASIATVTFRDPGTGAIALTVADFAFVDGRVVSIFAIGTAGALVSVANTDR